MYRRWKSGKVKKEEYLEGRRRMKEWMLRKQKEKKEEEEMELRKVKREVWKYINRKRKKKVWKDNNTGEEEWRTHFRKLLGGEEEERK